MSEQSQLQIMLDLETLGTSERAVILSIGACMFYEEGSGIHGEPFEVHVDPNSCVDAGLVMDASTVMWWMRDERDAARKVLMGHTRVALSDALNRFSTWMGADKPVWGNGATFDNVILRNAYAAAGKPAPWSYWNDRCYRTMKARTPFAMQRKGVHHSAMWDAISQAEHLQQIIHTLTTTGE